ncbi:MAG: glycosyltransferase, partial [Dehalococcoidia bacterium]
MRILKISQVYYPYLEKGGGAVKVRAIAEHLARNGHKVTVLTADLGPRDGTAEKQEREEPRGTGGVEVVYLRTVGGYRGTTVNPGVVSFCLQRLREFDLAHIYGIYDLLGPAVAHFCRKWGIPYLLEPMGMYRPIVRSLRKKRLFHRLLGRTEVTGTASIVATSDQERLELMEQGLPPDQIVVRRNGLDLNEFDTLPPRGPFRRELGL